MKSCVEHSCDSDLFNDVQMDVNFIGQELYKIRRGMVNLDYDLFQLRAERDTLMKKAAEVCKEDVVLLLASFK